VPCMYVFMLFVRLICIALYVHGGEGEWNEGGNEEVFVPCMYFSYMICTPYMCHLSI